MPTDVDQRATVSLRFVERRNDLLVLEVPNTDYQLHLVPGDSAGETTFEHGKRVRGILEATALRMHPAKGGGRFIEPVWGQPRIVAGTVIDADSDSHRVLVDVAVPMWVTAPPNQDFSIIEHGQLVNFYVESGATFTPVQ